MDGRRWRGAAGALALAGVLGLVGCGGAAGVASRAAAATPFAASTTPAGPPVTLTAEAPPPGAPGGLPVGAPPAGTPGALPGAPGAPLPPVPASRPATATIAVQGEGRIVLVPDVAQASFAVQSKAVTLDAASRDNARRTAAVVAALRAQGVAERDVQTTGYQANPVYDRDHLTGYQVVNSVRATIRPLDHAGAAIDAAIAAGADRIDGLSFAVADRAGALAQARTAAMADARAKAEQYAREGGLTLGAPLTIVESGATIPGPVVAGAQPRAAAATSDAPTTIAAGETVVVLTVAVTYGAAPGAAPR